MGSPQDGSVMHVVHVATVARHVEPGGDGGPVGYARYGGGVEPHTHVGNAVCREAAEHDVADAADGSDLGVQGDRGLCDVGGPLGFRRGRADGDQFARVRRVGGSAAIGRLVAIIVAGARGEAGYAVGEGSGALGPDIGVGIPTGGGGSLVRGAVV